ncbi:signal peptide peptidase SppA [Candidatus Poribacteria bacterium]
MFGDPQMLPGDKVAVLEIAGPIYSSQGVLEQLYRCRDDSSIKTIILRINSPGGAVAPVQEIYKELTRSKKKIVVSMGSTAASGGYYIACAAERIFANPGTLTGSIGVIMQFRNIDELMKKVGVEHEVVKSGRYKDSGSMYRELTSEEKELFQETIDDVYEQFLDAILEGRQHTELTREQLREIADGRVMSGKQALESQLVDELGDLSDAIDYAGKLGGIEGKPRVIRMKIKRTLMERVLRGTLGGELDQVIHDQAVLRYELL